tara:strand:+ start:325 stop:1521 length:1197 start_codon:yes stop_codon:yes gene_type:complete
LKPQKKSIAIIGGGASALFFSASIDTSKFSVTIYEKNKSLGRKFLVAGDGGFNLTHSEPIEQIVARYTPSYFLKEALGKFDNNYFQNWLTDIGIPTFVGSSKRVFPKRGIKPIAVLNSILHKIKDNGVEIKYEQTWTGWENGQLVFNSLEEVKSDIVIFALGGASWKVTGTDGSWLSYFEEKKIKTLPFQASNCAQKVNWKESFIDKFHGEALKNISVSCGEKSQQGEVVITKFGLEGNAIYALSSEIRKRLKSDGKATIFIDLKPHLSFEDLKTKFDLSSKNRTSILREKVKLNKIQLALLKSTLTKEEFMDGNTMLQRIKQLPIKLKGTATIDEAISTVGGISLSELSNSFELKKIPNHYCLGEMSDWDAPTGGYLMQACFSSAMFLSKNLNDSLI